MNDQTSLNQGLMQTTTIESKDDLNANDLESGIGRLEGVREVNVDGKTVSITYDPTLIDENAIREAVMNGGRATFAGGTGANGTTDGSPFGFVTDDR